MPQEQIKVLIVVQLREKLQKAPLKKVSLVVHQENPHLEALEVNRLW